MKMVKLSEITSKIGSGATPSGGSSVYSDNGISFVRSQNVLDMAFSNSGLVFLNEEQAYELRNVAIESGDILLNITGDSIARSCVVPENILPARVNQHVSIIRCKDKNDSEYLSFYLQYLKPYLLKICRVGGTRNALTKESMGKLPILYPIDRQEKVKILTLINQKIAINNQINAQLEQMAKTLYDYWFVQFDFPDENGKPYKSSGGEMVYNETLKREIPKGWEVGKIKDYCISTGGFAFKSTEWTSYGNPVIKIKNIKEDQTLDIIDMDYIDLSNRKIDEKFKGTSGNIVIAMTGATIGKFAIIPKSNVDLYINQRVGYFNLGNNPINRLPFLINSLNMDYFREAIFSLSNGAAQPNISNEQINNINLLLPHEILIQEFNQKLKSNYSLILNNQYENQQLTQLRDFLLPMLMNGQVGVGDG